MASALVNNVSMPPDAAFIDFCPSPSAQAATSYSPSSCAWLSPRISFSIDFVVDSDDNVTTAAALPPFSSSASKLPASSSSSDLDSPSKASPFEFVRLLDDPAPMLPADQLFVDGKLMPLQLTPVRPQAEHPQAMEAEVKPAVEADKLKIAEPLEQQQHQPPPSSSSSMDPYVFSPKAPRCSSRWRELLGLKKASAQQNHKPTDNNHKPGSSSSSSSSSFRNPNSKILKHFLLHRNTVKSASIDASLSLPLLHESDSELPVTFSSRRSLSSSSSSGPDHEEHPRLSLDFDKPNQSHPAVSHNRNPARLRAVSQHRAMPDPTKPLPDHPPVRSGRSQERRAADEAAPPRGASVDSPRMNPSGKIIFQGLGRSSSSPSSFNGGPRAKHRGVERSYSANVRVTPVLNVPMCSLRGSFGPLFSQQKKDSSRRGGGGTSVSRGGSSSGAGKGDKTKLDK